MGIFLQIFLRRNEFEADSFAAGTTGNPLALAEALKKLSVSSLSNLTPHPFYVFLNYSHPPMAQRLKALGNKGVAC
jgi:STE24 endopeptidase